MVIITESNSKRRLVNVDQHAGSLYNDGSRKVQLLLYFKNTILFLIVNHGGVLFHCHSIHYLDYVSNLAPKHSNNPDPNPE